MTAIFDFQPAMTLDIIPTECIIPTSLYVLPGPEILGIAVLISLLSCVSAEVYDTEFVKPPCWIADFRLLLTANYY